MLVFLNTANQKGVYPALVEKDFWVCYILDYLFNRSSWKDCFVFKGGTSLSKAFHVIERFSEDIDLILDWKAVIKGGVDPWGERTRNQQYKFNKSINEETERFVEVKLIPEMKRDIGDDLKADFDVYPDEQDMKTINFAYPRIFDDSYLRPVVRLEIGPLAEWRPHHAQKIVPYVAEFYGQLFERSYTYVVTLDAERTFWEKISILHKIANRNISKPFPRRYARHYYDVYCICHSDIKEKAFAQYELLEKNILFEKKFYYSGTAGYDTARIGTIRLLPVVEDMDVVRNDYERMKEMIFGRSPDFDEVIEVIAELQDEINNLASDKKV